MSAAPVSKIMFVKQSVSSFLFHVDAHLVGVASLPFRILGVVVGVVPKVVDAGGVAVGHPHGRAHTGIALLLLDVLEGNDESPAVENEGLASTIRSDERSKTSVASCGMGVSFDRV